MWEALQPRVVVNHTRVLQEYNQRCEGLLRVHGAGTLSHSLEHAASVRWPQATNFLRERSPPNSTRMGTRGLFCATACLAEGASALSAARYRCFATIAALGAHPTQWLHLPRALGHKMEVALRQTKVPMLLALGRIEAFVLVGAPLANQRSVQ